MLKFVGKSLRRNRIFAKLQIVYPQISFNYYKLFDISSFMRRNLILHPLSMGWVFHTLFQRTEYESEKVESAKGLASPGRSHVGIMYIMICSSVLFTIHELV
jgi:hypothetical protein